MTIYNIFYQSQYTQKNNQQTNTKMEKYRVLSVIGSGAYSQVFKAVQLSSGKMVAIKEMQLSKTNMAINKVMMRQVRVLNEIGTHPSIVKVIECFKHKDAICIVLEYLPMDLITFYKALRERERRGLSDSQIVYIFKQICSGVAFMHSKNLMHRDVKPENILIDPNSLKIKIIDFGFAKFLKSQDNTQYMVTRWYRPLQIVLNLAYDYKVDVFSLGAMLLQLYLQKQVFRSASNMDQLYWIINICGYPQWSQAIMKMGQMGINVPHNNPNLPKLLKGLRIQVQDLITKMLIAIPHKRISIFQVLQHPYFCQSPRKTDTPSSSASENLQLTPIYKIGLQKQFQSEKKHVSTSQQSGLSTERQSQRKSKPNQHNPEQPFPKNSQATQRNRQGIIQREKQQHQYRGFHQSNEGRKKIISGNKIGLGKRTQSFSQGLTITAARLKNNYVKEKQIEKTKINDTSHQLLKRQTDRKFQKFLPKSIANGIQTIQKNRSSNVARPVQPKQINQGISHSSSTKQISLSSKYKLFMNSQRKSYSGDKQLVNSSSSSVLGLRTREKDEYQTKNQKTTHNQYNGSSYAQKINTNNSQMPKKQIKQTKMTMFAKVKKICHGNNPNAVGVSSKGIENTQNKYALNFYENSQKKYQNNSYSSSSLSQLTTQRYSHGKNKQY